MEQGMSMASSTTSARRVLAASTITGDKVRNRAGEDLGKIEEVMLDLESGEVAYVVLSFGGFLGIGDKLFAVPYQALELDTTEHEFILDADRATLENAPGFDKDNWPNFADPAFGSQIHEYYDQEPYWERTTSSTFARPWDGDGVHMDETRQQEASAERINQPDLPNELRRRPVDVTDFPGRESDNDLKTADASRSYSVNDTSTFTRK